MRKSESLKFLKCLISRINLCCPSVPNTLKTTGLKLLQETNKILHELLENFTKFNDEIANLLDCYYTSGLLCVLLHRFSLETVGQNSSSTSEVSILQLNKSFFENLNEKFCLTERINEEIKILDGEKANLNKLFLLVKKYIYFYPHFV